MNKAGLVKKISEIYPYIGKKNVDDLVTIIIDSIIEALRVGKRVELRGFGVFWVKNREAAQMKNPKTGEKVFVQERKVPAFKAGLQLKEIINGLYDMNDFENDENDSEHYDEYEDDE